MITSAWTRMTVIALAACAVAALAAPAAGQTLRRDGSKAVPFVANVSEKAAESPAYTGPALRRDGVRAVPVVADLEPEPTADSEGFEWRTAGIAIGVGALAIVLGGAAMVSMRARRSPPRPRELSLK